LHEVGKFWKSNQNVQCFMSHRISTVKDKIRQNGGPTVNNYHKTAYPTNDKLQSVRCDTRAKSCLRGPMLSLKL